MRKTEPSQRCLQSNDTYRSARMAVIFGTLVLFILVFIGSLAFGTTSLAFSDVISSILTVTSNSRVDLIIDQIRLPRAMLATAIGAILGICGAATQGLFRNPLADPSLIGVTAGASAGGAVVIFLSSNMALHGLLGLSLISVGAFIGGCFSVVLVYSLATSQNGTSVATMLLAGIAITAMAGGLTNLVAFFADSEMLRHISIWNMGGLDGANYQRVLIASLIAIIIVLLLPRFSTSLNALLLGESEARHLGISVQKNKIMIVIIVAAGVATSVALAGPIAFVGLVVPHIIRLMIGPDHRYLLPMSALAGATLLLIADTIARTLFSPIEMPVGLVTAFIGAPFFIFLLRLRHDYGMR